MENSDTVVLGLRPPVDVDWRAAADGSIAGRINRIETDLIEVRRAGRRVRAWAVATAVGTGVATAAGAYCLVDRSFGRTDATLAWAVAGILLVGAAIGVLIRLRQLQRQRDLELQLQTERDVRGLIWTVERRDLWELTALSGRQAARFETAAAGQARSSFAASLVMAAAMVAVLVGGGALAATRHGTGPMVTAAALTVAGAALCCLLGWSFLRGYTRGLKHLAYRLGQPVVSGYLLHAERVREREGGEALAGAAVKAAAAAQAHLEKLGRR
jgi:hypothetical protein